MPEPQNPFDDGRQAVAPGGGAGGGFDLAAEEAGTLDKVPGQGGGGDLSEKPRSLWSDAWRDLRRNPIFIISALIILFLIFISLWPGVLASQDPLQADLSKAQQGSGPGHPFGYDQQGRDVYTRVIYGARASVTVGVCATLGVVILGSALGGLAGYFGGWWDAILSRISDVFFGIPVILGGLVFLSVITNSTVWPVVGFMILLGWPQIARIARGSVITAKQNDYVQAARALGAGNKRILLRHIAPNALAPVIVVGTIALGTYISLEATLSYLGVGLRPPTVSWGIDISDASSQIRNAPHMLLWPAGALSLTVLAFIMLGDAVRDALDPKLR
ncbi:ABC transporter permease [Actinacidiphila alni]|uniref:Oligopeptide transport system permease protein n=1 Tax=Actinacidiphila alni TaxID=380248 RepID=A0A1I2L3S6_9ACTN|nr:ABC transporter permease [Actinacidiphila alni]SFF73523.1 oligopeptide transport system permease protein [Actinacidiphila alni]